MRIQGAFVAGASIARRSCVGPVVGDWCRPLGACSALTCLLLYGVAGCCCDVFHYPYLDIRVNRKSKINVRIWVSLSTLDAWTQKMAKECLFANFCAVIVVIIKTHVRVFDS